jgi:hypothetical protein
VLDVVEAFRIRFPDVDACVGDRVPFSIFERAEDQQGLAVCVLRDQAAVRGVLRFVRVEGPRTVPSVLFVGLGWSIESTRRERPRMSERRINSWRSGVSLRVGIFASHLD